VVRHDIAGLRAEQCLAEWTGRGDDVSVGARLFDESDQELFGGLARAETHPHAATEFYGAVRLAGGRRLRGLELEVECGDPGVEIGKSADRVDVAAAVRGVARAPGWNTFGDGLGSLGQQVGAARGQRCSPRGGQGWQSHCHCHGSFQRGGTEPVETGHVSSPFVNDLVTGSVRTDDRQ